MHSQKSTYAYVKQTDKIKMIQFKESGMSIAEIGRKLKRDPKTVRYWLARWNEEESIAIRPKSGAGRSLDVQQEANLVIEAGLNSGATSQNLNQNFECTDRTVRRYLSRNDVESFKAPIKPAIVPINRESRVAFAQILRNWSADDWNKVIFTDESSFYSNRTCSRRVWRIRGVESTDELIVPASYRRFRVNIWAAISNRKIELITRVSEHFNSAEYLRLLEQNIPAIRNSKPDMIWQHDNVRFHRTEEIELFFERNGIQKMKWPAQSPDLNPIENFWAQISQRLDKMIDEHGEAKSANELYERVVDCAVNIPQVNFHNLYQSLPNRWNLVIQKQGGPTKY